MTSFNIKYFPPLEVTTHGYFLLTYADVILIVFMKPKRSWNNWADSRHMAPPQGLEKNKYSFLIVIHNVNLSNLPTIGSIKFFSLSTLILSWCFENQSGVTRKWKFWDFSGNFVIGEQKHKIEFMLM